MVFQRRAAIAVDGDHVYLAGALEFPIPIVGYTAQTGELRAMVEPVDRPADRRMLVVAGSGGAWTPRRDLAPGLHRLTVETKLAGPQAPTPVHDVFAVL